MNFVNYKKRSIALPPGCKDLIDVLRPPQMRKLLATKSLRHTHRGGEAVGTMADVSKYVGMLFGSDGMFTLAISSPDEQVTVQAMRTPNGVSNAGLYVQQDTTQERALRTFITNHGMTLPEETSTSVDWVPDAPVYRRYEFSPMPDGPRRFAELVVEILRDVFGLNAESQLHFHHDEVLDAAPGD